MIINYQKNCQTLWPNRSAIVASEALKLGVSKTNNLSGQLKHQDLVIWQYSTQTSKDDFTNLKRAANQIKIVLWINDFSCFIHDDMYKAYLTFVNYVVVPSNDDRLKLRNDYQITQIGVCTAFDLPQQRSLNAKVPINNGIHQITVKNKNSWQLIVKQLNQEGGFGFIDTLKESLSLTELSIFTEAGLPVVTPINSPVAKLISKYHLGVTVPKQIDKAVVVKTVSQKEFSQFARNSWNMGQKLAAGTYTRQALIEAIFHATIKKNLFEPYTSIYTKSRFNFKVMDTQDTLDFIDKYHPSISRFGDGEISLMNGQNQAFQDADPSLIKRLNQVIRQPSNSRLLLCMSDTFHGLDKFTPQSQDWWQRVLSIYQDYYQTLAKKVHHNVFGNTLVTRPYIDYKDKSHAGEVFKRIKQWWQGRDILLVEGYYTRSGVGNDLYDNARSIKRIICPSKNAWHKYEQIKKAIKHYGKNKLVLVMLGMTATVLAADLSDWGQVIDLGHLDSEYEWYKMGATDKVQIPFKHTAEMNFDQNIKDIHDEEYKRQIILTIV